jgi:hypothetical protein
LGFKPVREGDLVQRLDDVVDDTGATGQLAYARQRRGERWHRLEPRAEFAWPIDIRDSCHQFR